MHNQNTPKVSRFGFSVFVILLAGLAPISAHAVDTNYNMNRFLIQTHPFANTAPIPFEQPVPQKAPHAPLQKSPQTQAAGAQSPSKMAAHASAEQSDLTPGSYKWISEVRGGIMKHSVASLVGNRSKETGIDGNLEVLFVSPDLFKYIWSPRPHIGASVNTSSNNTDYGYAGLTWEWNPWKTVFFDFSFGLPVITASMLTMPMFHSRAMSIESVNWVAQCCFGNRLNWVLWSPSTMAFRWCGITFQMAGYVARMKVWTMPEFVMAIVFSLYR